VCTVSNTGGHGSNRKPAGTDRTGMHIGKWRVGDMNSVLVIPANNARSSAWRCCETAHLRRRSDHLFCTSDAEPMHMNGFVRLARTGRKTVLCMYVCMHICMYVCIYCRVVGVVLQCNVSCRGLSRSLLRCTREEQNLCRRLF
jgi:hypothetical protein